MLGGVITVKENLVIDKEEEEVFLYSFESRPKELNEYNEMIIIVRGSIDDRLNFPTWLKRMTEIEFLTTIVEMNFKKPIEAMVYQEKLRECLDGLKEHEEGYEFLVRNKYNEERVKEKISNDPMGQLYMMAQSLKELSIADTDGVYKEEKEPSLLSSTPKDKKERWQGYWNQRMNKTSLSEAKKINDEDMQNLNACYINDVTDERAISLLIETVALQNRFIEELLRRTKNLGGNK